MSSPNFEKLKNYIIPLSHSQDFASASKEWELIAVEISDEFDNCPCGQDIKEHCYIRNRITHHETYVGNICINRFMGLSTGTLFDGIKRIMKNRTANANDAVIEYAHKMGYLYGQNEYAFLIQTRLKKNLSAKQLEWKKKINDRILKGIVVRKRTKIH